MLVTTLAIVFALSFPTFLVWLGTTRDSRMGPGWAVLGIASGSFAGASLVGIFLALIFAVDLPPELR